MLNRAQHPSDVVALVVLWRLRYKLSLRNLPEMFAVRGMVFSHEAVREKEAKLTPALAEDLRRRRRGKVGRSWHVDETYLKAAGRWCSVCRACSRPCLAPQEVATAMPEVEDDGSPRSWRQVRVEKASHLRMVVDRLRPKRVGVVLRMGLALEHLQQRLDPGLPQLAVDPHRVGQEQVARA